MPNNFYNDASCFGLYCVGPALTADYERGKNLTASASPPTLSATAKSGQNAINYASASSQAHYVTDANLVAGFPMKNGDASKLITIAFWYNATTWIDAVAIVGKWDTNALRSIAVITNTGPNKLVMAMGNASGAAGTSLDLLSGAVTGTWYHIAVTYAGDTSKAMHARVWDDSAQVAVNYDANSATNVQVSTAALSIGSYMTSGAVAGFINGIVNEVVVFNRVLSDAQIDAIRSGLYGTLSQSSASASQGGLARNVLGVRSLRFRRPSLLKQHR